LVRTTRGKEGKGVAAEERKINIGYGSFSIDFRANTNRVEAPATGVVSLSTRNT
jgi:hypothetical protein